MIDKNITFWKRRIFYLLPQKFKTGLFAESQGIHSPGKFTNKQNNNSYK